MAAHLRPKTLSIGAGYFSGVRRTASPFLYPTASKLVPARICMQLRGPNRLPSAIGVGTASPIMGCDRSRDGARGVSRRPRRAPARGARHGRQQRTVRYKNEAKAWTAATKVQDIGHVPAVRPAREPAARHQIRQISLFTCASAPSCN
jgi:hypothetical protein